MSFAFLAPPPDPRVEAFRHEVRGFLIEAREEGLFTPASNCWVQHDPAFSRACGARGFIGVTWPRRYGGHERSEGERFALLEEMLAAGAPVGAHWIADRQSGTQILRLGSERLKAELLPRIARGECYFGIGMSEPDTGSDLASVRSRAHRVEGGWRITGRKVWTTNAHKAHYLIALVRTGEGAERHAGLSQMVVDLAAPGVSINPILNIAGRREFNEVVFDDCFVPDDAVLGEVGAGWRSVTGELALERSGPDRYLSLSVLIARMCRATGPEAPAPARREVGRVLAQLATLRHMSRSVAATVQAGGDPGTEAALVKDLGTTFEQELPEVARRILSWLPEGAESAALREAAETAMLEVPSFSLRGGTREVLRGIVARQLRLR